MANFESANRFQVLCYEQILRLHQVMGDSIPVHGRGNFPTVHLKLKELVPLVKDRLKKEGITVNDVRLNGGAASYILGLESPVQSYNDLDLIFRVELADGQEDLHKCKTSTLSAVLEFLPAEVNRKKINSNNLGEAYVQKMFKVVTETDKWSLVSLSNIKGRNVELKFVHSMKRQFEFSVDSFQILLDSLLTFYDISEKKMSEHFYPTVVAESVYGNFSMALHHLNKKQIATRNPEQIRGGGLLKYCSLLVHGYKAAPDVDIKALERYMCSRFFIDFPGVEQQRLQLGNYLANHFVGENHLKYEFLMILFSVIDESTVCLMGHERRQTLEQIQHFASCVRIEQEQEALRKYYAMQKFDSQNFGSTLPGLFDEHANFIVEQVVYHTKSPAQSFIAPNYKTINQYLTPTPSPVSACCTPPAYQITCPCCQATYLQCS